MVSASGKLNAETTDDLEMTLERKSHQSNSPNLAASIRCLDDQATALLGLVESKTARVTAQQLSRGAFAATRALARGDAAKAAAVLGLLRLQRLNLSPATNTRRKLTGGSA